MSPHDRAGTGANAGTVSPTGKKAGRSLHAGCCCSRHGDGPLEAFLLLLIAEKPCHGYEMIERLQKDFFATGPAPDEATIYRNLRRMEEQNLVVSAWDTAGTGPPRRFYEVTSGGMERLSSWRRDIEARRRRLTMFADRLEALKSRSTVQRRGDREGE